MSEDISKLIGTLMQNPDAVKNLMGAIGGSSSSSSDIPDVSNEEIEGITDAFAKINQNDDRRIVLLNAIKPYLRSSRAGGIDRIVKLLKLAKMSEYLRNERE